LRLPRRRSFSDDVAQSVVVVECFVVVVVLTVVVDRDVEGRVSSGVVARARATRDARVGRRRTRVVVADGVDVECARARERACETMEWRRDE